MSIELPPGWIKARLSDLCVSIADGDHQAPPKSDQGVPFITISAMNDGTVNIKKASRFVPKNYWAALSAERAPTRGDILVSVTGSIGIAAPVDTDEPFVFQRHIAVLRPDRRRVCRSYLLHALRSTAVLEQYRDIATGTAQLTIPLGGLRNVLVPLPPLAEQRRIVARIEALFARTRRARTDLERIALLARHHRDRVLATAFNDAWPETIVGELAAAMFDGPFGSNLKSSDYVPSGTRVVRLENIGHLRFIRDKETFISNTKATGLRRHRLAPGDLLFSSFVDKEVRVCLFPNDLPTAAINKADCFCIRTDRNRCDPEFLALRLASPMTYEDVRDAVHGATRPRIGLTDLRNYHVRIPDLESQRRLVTEVKAAHRASHLMEHEATRAVALLGRLEQSILTRTFRGELVPQDPLDEPAAVALARRDNAPAPRTRDRRATGARS